MRPKKVKCRHREKRSMKQKLSILLVIVCTHFMMFFTISCPSKPLDYDIDLYVPYYSQGSYTELCAVACIKMWAAMSGNNVSMDEISDYVGCGSWGTRPVDIPLGVARYTCAEGYLAIRDRNEAGAQGDLVSATVVGIEHGVPSIMPFFVDHAVLIKGSKYRKDETGRPIAINLYLHDPEIGPNRVRTASEIATRFMSNGYNYWVVVGFPEFLDMGIYDHNTFVLMGGTYYGGPSIYDPKGLNPDPSTFQ